TRLLLPQASRGPGVSSSPSDPARRPSLGRAAAADVSRRTWQRVSQSATETSIPRQLLPEYGSLGDALRFLPICTIICRAGADESLGKRGPVFLHTPSGNPGRSCAGSKAPAT